MTSGRVGTSPAPWVGRYRLDGVIGVGSFATVHQAVDDRLDDTVVVKLLAENHSLNPEIRERFITEGRALRRVRSPHVVTVHDIGESDRQQPYLVLELADRGNLADRVRTLRAGGWRASAADVLVVARQVAAALEAVHAARLVHRDLSPANVLLTSAPDAEIETGTSRGGGRGTTEGGGSGTTRSSGRAGTTATDLVRADERLLLADLGMCKDLALGSGLTVAGGTAGFRPPELDGGPAVIDTRADLWSLSALVAWLVEGADLPEQLRTVLVRGQAHAPDDRQPDVVTWLAEVEEALEPPAPTPAVEPPVEAGVDHLDPRNGTLRRTAYRGSGRGLAALVLLALLLGLGGGWLLRGSGDPPAATGSARVQIEAPEQVRVGEPATFALRHLGVDSWVWVLPTGEHVVDEESVTVTPTGAGTARLSVRSVDDAGRVLEDVLEFSVIDP